MGLTYGSCLGQIKCQITNVLSRLFPEILRTSNIWMQTYLECFVGVCLSRHLGRPYALTFQPWVRPSWTTCWVCTTRRLPAGVRGPHQRRIKLQRTKLVMNVTISKIPKCLPVILFSLSNAVSFPQLISWRALTPITHWFFPMKVTSFSWEVQLQIQLWGSSCSNSESLYPPCLTPSLMFRRLGSTRYKKIYISMLFFNIIYSCMLSVKSTRK